jgi:hypothetical protein
MKKKIIWIVAVLLVFALALAAYWTFFGPKANEGEKKVTIRVIVEKEGINKSFEYDTDLDFLGQLINEKKEELEAEISDMGGSFVKGMAGYVADESKNEFFSIKINDVDAMVGIDEIPLTDEDTYTFELTTW